MEGQAIHISESLLGQSSGLSDETNAGRTAGTKDDVSGTTFQVSSLGSHGSSAQETGDQLTESNIKWGYYSRPKVEVRVVVTEIRMNTCLHLKTFATESLKLDFVNDCQ